MSNLEYYNKLINQNTMKKILFTLLCSLFLFTACSDDDERSEAAPYLRIPEIGAIATLLERRSKGKHKNRNEL